MTESSTSAAVYLTRLEVENVRCFGPQQVLDLTDQEGKPASWTVVLGENGTGKTTLLQLLVAVVQRERALVDLSPTSSVRLECRDRNREGGASWYRFRPGTTRDDAFLFTPSEPRTLAYGATRAMSPGGLADSEQSAPNATLFDPNARLVNAEEWLLKLDYLAKSEGPTSTANGALDRVKMMLIELLPDVTGIHILGPRVAAPGRSPGTGGVAFDTPYGRVPMRGLSLGYQTLTAWTVDLAYRLYALDPACEKPLAQPCVVLVDEIDLHLHPTWQRQIQHRLLEWFPGAQFIVTAHSPLVVQAAMDANLAVLRRVGDHVEIENDPQVVRGWRVDQILTSDLFGLDSARSPEINTLQKERARLLSQRALSLGDAARVREIDAALHNLPYGETRDDQRAQDLIRRAAKLLKDQGAT